MEQEKIKSGADMDFKFFIKLNEQEAKALYTITSYGHKPFLEWFYNHLGKHYMKPHEDGLISLFETIKKELPQHFRKCDEARKVFSKQ